MVWLQSIHHHSAYSNTLCHHTMHMAIPSISSPLRALAVQNFELRTLTLTQPHTPCPARGSWLLA